MFNPQHGKIKQQQNRVRQTKTIETHNQKLGNEAHFFDIYTFGGQHNMPNHKRQCTIIRDEAHPIAIAIAKLI